MFKIIISLILFSLITTNFSAWGQSVSKNKESEEYLPLIRVAPQYPARAIENKVEGYVILSFTVNEKGTTENVKVLESSHRMFERAAVKATQKYKYRPRSINGIPQEVNDVRTRIDFSFGSRF